MNATSLELPICIITVYCQIHTKRYTNSFFGYIFTSTQEAAADFEAKLLKRFRWALDKGRTAKMRKCAETLVAFNGGEALAQVRRNNNFSKETCITTKQYNFV